MTSVRSPLAFALLSAAVAVASCSSPQAAQTADPPAVKKIPITTASAEARARYLEGRSLVDRLQIQSSLALFDEAIALDPGFAMAEFGRANASPTGAEFFAHMASAVRLAVTASAGERLLIQAGNAAASGHTADQKRLLDELLAAYPDDERAQFAMGNYAFGQQDFTGAIEHYAKAASLAPDYSAPYNLLGYAYRQVGDYPKAEQAFQRYIELIPNDPNPHDSYGELLLKMGKFDASIAQYRQALAIDPQFQPSHLGIATDLMYAGKAGEAAAEYQQAVASARNDAERRAALFGLTALAVDHGKMADALGWMDKQYAIAEHGGDTAGMTADLGAKALIYLEMGRPDQAGALWDKAMALVEGSTLPDAVKANATLVQHGNLARVALARHDVATAGRQAAELARLAQAAGNAFQVKQAHEIAGMIALAGKHYDEAIGELQQASLQNPYNLYRLCLAYDGKGDAAKARELCTAAATYNPLPQLNFAFIRARAAKRAGRT